MFTKGIRIILLYFVVLILQSVWMNIFPIFSTYPDFVLMYLMIVSITRNNPSSTIFGFVFGLIYDIFLGNFFCVTAISYTIISFIFGNLSKIIDYTHLYVQLVLTVFGFLFSFLLMNIFVSIFYKVPHSHFFEFIGCLLYSLPFVVPFYIKLKTLVV